MARRRIGKDDAPLVVSPGSWLGQSSAVKDADGTVSWLFFTQPDLSPRSGDTFYDVATEMYPQSIADLVYGDENLWWVIAVANDLRLPFSQIAPGVRLRIPDAGYVSSIVRGDKPGRSA